MSPGWAFLVGVLCLPILLAAAGFGSWAFRRDGGTWTCDNCKNARPIVPGEQRNITVWALSVRHEVLTVRRAWHRKAWAADEWNPANLSKNDGGGAA